MWNDDWDDDNEPSDLEQYEQECLRWELEQERQAHQREGDLIDDIRHGYADLG